MEAGAASLDRCAGCGGDLVYGETILVVGQGTESTREAAVGTCDAREVSAAYHPECFPEAPAEQSRSA